MTVAGASLISASSVVGGSSIASSSVATSSIPVSSEAASLEAASLEAVSSEAASSEAASSEVASKSTSSDAIKACAVCAAKASGCRVPKRKCTCDSGQTLGRSVCRQEQSRVEEREQRNSFEIMFDSSFYEEDISDDEQDEADELETKLEVAVQSGDVDALRLLGKRGISSHNWVWQDVWRSAMSAACEHGQVHALEYLIDECGMSLANVCPHHDWLHPDHAKEHNLVPVPNPAPPLFISVFHKQVSCTRLLLRRGADVNGAAFDGCTPFNEACAGGNMELVQLLHEHGADIVSADQDGAAPIHIAALEGHLDIIDFLLANGVDMSARGCVFTDTSWEKQLKYATPLMIARHMGHTQLVNFLQSRVEISSAPPAAPKHSRSTIPIHERAELAGVAHRLKPIPPNIRQDIQSGSAQQKKEAKKLLQKIQIANQQIVSRAEQARLKQAKLWQ